MLGEGSTKSLVWHPNEPVRVGRQLGRLRMWLLAIEHLGDRLAFIRRQSCDENQRSNSLVGRRGVPRKRAGLAPASALACYFGFWRGSSFGSM
jgi:hypothetical protein